MKYRSQVHIRFEWLEGSAADGRVLHDAVHRQAGIKVPTGVRYHLKEWDRGAGGPQSPRELFNLRHASARNVIERTFGLLKTRWGILKSPSYYPIRVQNEIIIACCLLHNFVRMEMTDDPLELEVPDVADRSSDPGANVMNLIDEEGWKCENGFRSGYLNQLESIMCKQLPNTDIKAEPHINSKIHVWKKNYGSLVAMMGKSGFGWDDTRCMITVDNQDIWNEYCKDRAVGEVTVEAHPTVNNDDSEKDTETQSYYVPTAEWCPDFGYVEAVNAFCDTAKQHLVELSKKLFVDYEEVEKRAVVFEAVCKVPGIDLNDQIYVSDRLVENPKKMDLFFSLPAEARAHMVGLMLSGKV
ncbi:UNVERIFIED_CONTAM: hypothetical protein Sradi_0656900 [Sesamum radiatum]|uniref:DDE Tnp4 domain-containing protein n=1 Tax=Sesamum radiatum TaxID=300843 RepID=A0AAW2VL68_SESRA